MSEEVIPEWLLKKEYYDPQPDKDTFVDKSILSLLSLLSRMRAQGRHSADYFAVNSVFKVAFTFLLIVLLSISRSFTFVIIVNVYLLVVISLMKAGDIVKILRVSLTVALFTFIILLPSAFWGNSYSCIMITSKVLASVTAVNILSHSTRWTSITGALKRFFMPDIFIFVLDITIKYIVMLGEFSLNLLYSLKLRSVGRNKNKYTSLSGIAGTMFIKSKEMAEEMYAAMECRGFTGEYQIYKNYKLTLADLIYVIINICITFLFIYFERLSG